MELGIYTFAENTPDPVTGRTGSPAQRLRDLIEEIELADQVGLDVFGVGEHHRPEYVVSAPAVVLAAAAEHTKRIRLTSAVTVLSSDDPVRVFQDFATLEPLQDPLPVWVAVGGTPQSVVRAGTLGLPMALAIIGGAPERFVPLVDLYRESARRAGHDPARLPVGINSHGFLVESSEQAANKLLGTEVAPVVRREAASVEAAGLNLASG